MASLTLKTVEHHFNDDAVGRADLLRFTLTDLQCTFNANRREQGVLARQKQNLQAELGRTPLPIGQDKADLINSQIASIDHDIAEIRRDNTALAADIREVQTYSWGLFLAHALFAGSGATTHFAPFEQQSLYVDCALSVARTIAAYPDLPSQRELAVKKLDELLRADATKTEDRFAPRAGESGFAAAIPRIVKAAFDAVPAPSVEG